MSIDDFDKYDDELTEREHKNSSETDVNKKRYKGITIETLNSWPDDLIVATLCSMGADGNLFAGVNLQDDEEVIQIDKWAKASELYFFKLLMKADTNIAFGEEFVVLDTRVEREFKALERTLTVDSEDVTIPAEGGTVTVAVTASGEYSVSASPAGFAVKVTDEGIAITGTANETDEVKSGEITLTLDSDKTKEVIITVAQDKQEG